MIEGVLVDDEGNTLYTPIGETGIKSVAPSKWKIWLSATGLVALMVMVSLQGWIIDDVVDDIKRNWAYTREFLFGKGQSGLT